MSETNDIPIVGWIHRTALSIVHGGHPAKIYPTQGRSAYCYQLVSLADAQAALSMKDTEIAEIRQSWQAATDRATASRWQPIETAPMHEMVLVSVVGCGVTVGSRIGSCGWSWEELDDEPADAIVSHWMPLPAPPAVRQSGAV